MLMYAPSDTGRISPSLAENPHAIFNAPEAHKKGTRRRKTFESSAEPTFSQVQCHSRQMIPAGDTYLHDRMIPSEQTVQRMTPLLRQFGITRIARQTDLDSIGIPCFSAIRPNAFNLSSSQGKGLTDFDAQASAIMEAIEYAVAERPAAGVFRCSARRIQSEGELFLDPSPFMPQGFKLDRDQPLDWVRGRGLITYKPFAVPYDVVAISGNARQLKGVCQTTNGLASGNTEHEAIFHGLCELVERDANTVWLMSSSNNRRMTALALDAVTDPTACRLITAIKMAGFELHLFNQTTDLTVPVIMAVIGDRRGASRKFQMAAGYGAHPIAVRSLLRAITEAAQTRITSIVSSRDDIESSEFTAPIESELFDFLDGVEEKASFPSDLCAPSTPQSMTKAIVQRLMYAKLKEPIVIPLTRGDWPFSVVRVLSAALEDIDANIHWRPGHRAKAAALA